MATLTTTPAAPTRSWREMIHVTRMGIFGVFFTVVGLVLLLSAPSGIASGVTTTLTFGPGRPDDPFLVIPSLPFVIIVALLYIGGGLAAILPHPIAHRVRSPWILLNGLLIIPTVLVIVAADNSTNALTMVVASLRLATPIVIGAMAGIWCERSGVVNIAIEGMMLTGACFGFVAFSLLVGNGMGTGAALLIGVGVSVMSGALMSVLHAWLSITFKTDQIVSGTVINILAIGLTSFARRAVLLSSEAGRETLPNIRIPILADIPIIGEVLFNNKPIFYCMFILIGVTYVVLWHTRWGLRTRAVGENPRAADTLGINVNRNRWINVIIGGMIAGLAGAWFSLETTGSFDDNMTSGRGFIGLAAMIFGKWHPFGAFGGGMLFGFSDALGLRFQFLEVPVPPQFLQMVPYLVTMIVLAGLVGKATGPKASGTPYEKENKG